LEAPRGIPEASIGDLFTRLKEDGSAYVKAEVGLYSAIARHRVGKARNGAIALVAAFLLLNAALITLVISIAAALALKVGPILGGLITFAIVGIIAFILVKWGAGKLSALSGDEEERKALAAGANLS
jgi:hypothetical protein